MPCYYTTPSAPCQELFEKYFYSSCTVVNDKLQKTQKSKAEYRLQIFSYSFLYILSVHLFVPR